jgi:hypothetical protein
MQSYKEIEQRLRNLEPFRGNSLHAIKNLDSNSLEVYSYSTLIATAHAPSSEKRVYWLNQSKYSVTTSRHQNLIRRAWRLI